jgi:hypothetical protein
MMPPVCARAQERAPEFALGVLDAGEQSEMVLHLDQCARCQAFVDSLSEVVDRLPRLAPEIEPPVGFDRRVRSAMLGPRRRSARRWVSAIAVAAAAATIVSVGVVRIVDADREIATEVPPPQRSVAMQSDGVRVGSVTIAGREQVAMRVTVDYAVPDGTYALELTSGGTVTSLGSLDVTRSRGEWSGTASLPRGDDAILAMVDADGREFCQAVLRPVSLS